jgi:hypothetical protein
MKPIYRVSFFKKLTNSTGHLFDVCQGAVEVHTCSPERAVEAARVRFAEINHDRSWNVRADYEKIEFLPTRKRISRAAWRDGVKRSRGPAEEARSPAPPEIARQSGAGLRRS